MKKAFKLIFGFAMLAAVITLANFGYSAELSAFANDIGIGGAYSFITGSPNAGIIFANTAALVTQFSQQVEKRPAPNNGFLQYCVDESSLINGEKVVRPVEGDDPVALTNPTKFPLEIEQKDDDSNEYPIALHATKPQRISDSMQLMVNYALRQGIIDRHGRVINHKIAREILFNWSPSLASNIISSTGAGGAPTLTKWGAAGHRKLITKDDIIDGIKLLKEDDVDEDGMGIKMLLPVGFSAQIFKGLNDFVDYQKTGRADMLAKGILGNIMGADIISRSTALIYDENNVAKRATFTGTNNKISVGATHCQGILIWSPAMVYKAIGKMTPYIDPVSGQLLGSTVNFSQRAGGNKRKDEMGVVAVVEDFVD